MSYILEALKKAQAERQMGTAPTIYTPPVHAVPAGRPNRSPVLVWFAAGALILAAAAAVFWRQQSAAKLPIPPLAQALQPVAVRLGSTAAQGTPAPQLALAVDSAPPAPEQTDPDTYPLAMPSVPPVAIPSVAPPVAAPGATPAGRPMSDSAPVRPAAPVAPAPGDLMASRAAAPPLAAPPAAMAGGGDDTLRTLAELPEAVRREVPNVTIDGFIYSPNPTDRVLLVDRMLRHEGEELARGLVLEKLLPKAAVMNYKGHRYRVQY